MHILVSLSRCVPDQSLTEASYCTVLSVASYEQSHGIPTTSRSLMRQTQVPSNEVETLGMAPSKALRIYSGGVAYHVQKSFPC